ncbi:hypothetical protein [Clostridium estertheticum]|nr:hypothetical protein [Clostridium estertheticum]MBZ9614299.1 hypothetical protein [Clostridium estertheticum subsp. laramiense]
MVFLINNIERWNSSDLTKEYFQSKNRLKDEKDIYIADIEKVYDMSIKIPNAKFICSQWNKEYKRRHIDHEGILI